MRAFADGKVGISLIFFPLLSWAHRGPNLCMGDGKRHFHLRGKRLQVVLFRIRPQVGQNVKDPVMAHRAPK
jgi:hypothetical protein